MVLLIVGLVAFFTIHMVPTKPDLRDGLVQRYGEGAYKAGFAIASLIAFAVIVIGYHKMQLAVGSKNPILFEAPTWSRHLAMLLMIPAFIFLVAAYVPSKIKAALKHPMLVAVKIWALSHLLANGDVASLVLFSSFLAYAVFDRISLKKRGEVGGVTGATPVFNDVIVVAVGLGLYAAMLFFGHQYLIGVPLIG